MLRSTCNEIIILKAKKTKNKNKYFEKWIPYKNTYFQNCE